MEDCFKTSSSLCNTDGNFSEKSRALDLEDILCKQDNYHYNNNNIDNACENNITLKNDCDLYMKPETSRQINIHDIGTHCTPQLMGIVKNKTIQTIDTLLAPEVKTASVQTSFDFGLQDAFIQMTEKTEAPVFQTVSTQTCPVEETPETVSHFSQTDAIQQQDFGMQSFPPWRLISVSLFQKPILKPTKAKKYLNLGPNEQIKIFYERPLIETKWGFALIPLEPVPCLTEMDTAVSDPRIRSDCKDP